MIILGLTGSIGMGKSTASKMFAEAGVPIYSADDAVHSLYAGRAAPLIEAAFPGTVENGIVDRQKLSVAVLNDSAAMKRLEQIVHPLVQEEENAFIKRARASNAPIILLDIPLLFEKNGESRVDVIVVVSAPADLQRARVLARPDMSVEKFENILTRQMPDVEKRQRADFIIETGGSFDAMRKRVAEIIAKLRADPKI